MQLFSSFLSKAQVTLFKSAREILATQSTEALVKNHLGFWVGFYIKPSSLNALQVLSRTNWFQVEMESPCFCTNYV